MLLYRKIAASGTLHPRKGLALLMLYRKLSESWKLKKSFRGISNYFSLSNPKSNNLLATITFSPKEYAIIHILTKLGLSKLAIILFIVVVL